MLPIAGVGHDNIGGVLGVCQSLKFNGKCLCFDDGASLKCRCHSMPRQKRGYPKKILAPSSPKLGLPHQRKTQKGHSLVLIPIDVLRFAQQNCHTCLWGQCKCCKDQKVGHDSLGGVLGACHKS